MTGILNGRMSYRQQQQKQGSWYKAVFCKIDTTNFALLLILTYHWKWMLELNKFCDGRRTTDSRKMKSKSRGKTILNQGLRLS
ncbi:hypothetical protein Y1Q_0014153 [Alligator mississippiensis]|uniref:Uncharacterized protein n=1 Tax=Alligator mississippiensis TaxID=8496 RepID=A0A151MTV2_ALLMI|nr:hypothetical protein Y1Q_0014153 [Alligator mississippiensis]